MMVKIVDPTSMGIDTEQLFTMIDAAGITAIEVRREGEDRIVVDVASADVRNLGDMCLSIGLDLERAER